MIASTKIEQATKTQLYRYLNGFERFFTASRKANQLALLADDITLTTPRGSISGTANYIHSLSSFKGMKIAHAVEDITVKTLPSGLITATVSLIYHGVQKSGEGNSLRFIYETELYQQPNQLPLFKTIQLGVDGAFESTTFQDSYIKSRSLALLHYYLFLIEKIPTNADDFQEILTDDFTLNFSPTTTLTTIDQLGNWLAKVAIQLSISSHYPTQVEVQSLAHETYKLTVDFDWEGWTVDGQKLTAATRHTWVIKDRKNDRFAKIQSIVVEGRA